MNKVELTRKLLLDAHKRIGGWRGVELMLDALVWKSKTPFDKLSYASLAAFANGAEPTEKVKRLLFLEHGNKGRPPRDLWAMKADDLIDAMRNRTELF
jgi:hypothetical protein